MEYRYTGIILNKRDIGETDRIYTVYTLEGGKIRSLAKGVRKPHAKLAASLENITLADVTVIRSRGLGKITGSIVENNFSSLKCDCDALLETFAGVTIFEKLIDFENPDQKVFLLLKEYLETVDFCAQEKALNDDLEYSVKVKLIRLGFVVQLLDALGYTIKVDSCVICSEKLSEKSLCFSSEHGGALCGKCSLDKSDCALPVEANVIKLLRLFLGNNINTLIKVKASQSDCDAVRLVVDDFLRWTF